MLWFPTALRVLEVTSWWCAAGRGGRGGDAVPAGLDPKVIAVYKGVGEILRRYTTGRVPKAFKVRLFRLAVLHTDLLLSSLPDVFWRLPASFSSGHGWRQGPTVAAQSGSCLLLIFQQNLSYDQLLFPVARKTACCSMHSALKFPRTLVRMQLWKVYMQEPCIAKFTSRNHASQCPRSVVAKY